MPALRGITVSVGQWYADLLRITLWRNQRHLVETLVVTAPGDPAVEVARAVPGVSVFTTDGFTRPDKFGRVPRFNKGLALSEAFEHFGRHGVLCLWDADILLPDSIPLDRIRLDCLNGAKRRILADPGLWTPGLDWDRCPKHPDGAAPIGFLQIWAADAAPVRDAAVWYDVTFPHGGGSDAFFLSLWPREKWNILPMEVLHLGQPDQAWFGSDQEGRDLMAKFVVQNGWRRAARHVDPAAVERAGELPPRLVYEGYPVTGFELPFVERAKAGKR